MPETPQGGATPCRLPLRIVAPKAARLGHDSSCMSNESEPFRNIGAVILAAGEASRFGAPKQRLLLPLVIDALRQTPIEEIVVVEGAYPLRVEGARVVRADGWNQGPGASLRAGLTHLDADVEAAVVVLADGPDLNPAAVERLVLAWRAGAGEILAAAYTSERGHPVVVGRTVWDAIPVGGLRQVRPTLVACDDLGPPGDIDTTEDLDALLRRSPDRRDRLGEDEPLIGEIDDQG